MTLPLIITREGQMSLSLQSQANERRSRLAALRKKVQSKSSDSQDDSQDSGTKDGNKNKDEVQIRTEEEITGPEPINSEIIHENTDPEINGNIGEPEDSISDTSVPPTLRISNSETVEVIAGKIQQEIFDKLKLEASQAISPTSISSSQEKFVNNADLKSQLVPYLKRAHYKTQLAINKIVQKKYDEANGI